MFMDGSIWRQKPKLMLDCYPLRGNDSASCVINGQTLIVQSKIKKLYVLNSAGTRIWEMADGRHEIRDIVEKIKAQSGKPEHKVRKEIETFIVELIDRQVLIILRRPWDVAV